MISNAGGALSAEVTFARRLSVSKQIVSRYEENAYEGVSIVRLQELLDAWGVKAKVPLTA